MLDAPPIGPPLTPHDWFALAIAAAIVGGVAIVLTWLQGNRADY